MRICKVVIGLLVALIIFTNIGCGGNGNNSLYNFDANALADRLAKLTSNDEELTNISSPEEYLRNHYNLPDKGYISMATYMGDEASAEEVTVFVCDNNNIAKDTYKLCEEYIEDSVNVYKDYNPKAVKLLQSALLERKNNVVIYCATPNIKDGNKIIKSFLRKERLSSKIRH